MLPRYREGGRGDVADETDDESYDLVEGLGDRGYGLCDVSAMISVYFDRVHQSPAGSVNRCVVVESPT